MSILSQRVPQPCPLEDICLESLLTGEIVPYKEALSLFYETHEAGDDWHSEWKETDISAAYVREMIRSVEEQELKM